MTAELAPELATELAAAPLGAQGITLIVVITNAIVLATLLAVVGWMRRVPRRVRDRAAAGAGVSTLADLSRRDPLSLGAPPISVTGVLTADPGPEIVSPVTRRACALFRVELDRLSDLEGMHSIGRQANVCSSVPAVLTDATGSVLIDPELIAPDPEWLTDTRRTGPFPKPGELYVRPERNLGTTGFAQREFVVPADVRVTVAGRMVLDADGWLRPARRAGPMTLTSKPPAELIAAGAPENVTWRWLWRRVGPAGLITVVALNAALLLGLAH